MCVCVVFLIILGVRFVDVPAEITQEEGHTGFLHLPSAVLALIFLAKRIQAMKDSPIGTQRSWNRAACA